MSAKPQLDIERPLPQARDAERCVLGASLLDNAAYPVAAEILDPSDFRNLDHQTIFRCMGTLLEKGSAIDTPILMHELETLGKLEQAGGVAYISTLADGLPRISNVKHYAAIVKEKAKLRALIDGGNALVEAGFSKFLDEGEIQARLANMAVTFRPAAEPIKIVTLAELRKMKIPPREMLLEPILPVRSMSEIFAWRGVGKTYLALALAYAIASGRKIFKWQAPKPRPVLYVDGELDPEELQKRLRALDHADDSRAGGNLRILNTNLQGAPFPHLATQRAQRIIEDALRGEELLVLDNLSALAPSADDKDSEDWIAVQVWLSELKRQGISTIFLHHAGHAGWSRGTTRREDLLDIVIDLRRPKDYVASEGLRFELHFTKTRGLLSEAVRPIAVQLETDLDGHLQWTYRDVEDVREAEIVELRDGGMSFRDIEKQTGIPKSTAERLYQKSKVAKP